MNLFYVESPFQLLCAYEVSKIYGNGKYIIRLSENKRNDIQLKNLVIFLNIKHFEYIYLPAKSVNISSMFMVFKNRLINYEKIFIGNFDSKFMKIIISLYGKNKICLLDDGAKTIFIQNKIFNDKKNHNIFTIFKKLKPYDNQKIYLNTFENLKHIINQKSLLNQDYILFIGSKLVELNMINQDDYLNYILKIYNKFNLPIIYVAHRGEDLSKFDKLNNIDFKTVFVDYPVELYGFYNGYIPQKIVSFYSTALFSLKLLYNSEFYYIKYDFENDIVKSVYDYLKATDIKEIKF